MARPPSTPASGVRARAARVRAPRRRDVLRCVIARPPIKSGKCRVIVAIGRAASLGGASLRFAVAGARGRRAPKRARHLLARADVELAVGLAEPFLDGLARDE